MTILNAVAGLVVPMLMTPVVFAQYSLVVSFFQYGLIFDLGASQLADRILPGLLGQQDVVVAEIFGQQLLWFRLIVGICSFAVVTFVMSILAAVGRLPFDLLTGLLSACAGLIYMVALGPACIYRALARRREYALSVSALSAGLVVARIGGLAAGGMVGCFAALTLWYAGLGGLLTSIMPPRRALRPTFAQIVDLAVKGAPLFATSFFWIFYQTANRWIGTGVLSPSDFVLFAFGANVLTLLVGAIGAMGALWYPGILANFACDHASTSRQMQRDYCLLLCAATTLASVGILSAWLGLHLLFPKFIESAPIVRVFLIAIPASALASWLMPVSLSAGPRPWIDGVVLYPVATVVLAVGLPFLYSSIGIEGAALASAVSALVLTAMQLVLLVDAGIMTLRQAASIEAASVIATIALSLFVWVLV